MNPQQVVEHFGGVTAAATALGIKPPSVSGWIEKGEVPIDRQCQIEVITGGRLVADRRALKMMTPQQAAHAGSPQRRQMG